MSELTLSRTTPDTKPALIPEDTKRIASLIASEKNLSPLSPELIEEYAENGYLHLSHVNGDLAGFGVGFPVNEDWMYLSSFYVLPKYRKSKRPDLNIGEDLFEKIVNSADGKNMIFDTVNPAMDKYAKKYDFNRADYSDYSEIINKASFDQARGLKAKVGLIAGSIADMMKGPNSLYRVFVRHTAPSAA